MKNKVIFVSLSRVIKNYSHKTGNTYYSNVLNTLRTKVWDGYKIAILGDFENEISINGISPLQIDHRINLFMADLGFMISNHEDSSKRINVKDVWINTFISDDPTSFWNVERENVFTEVKYNHNTDLSKSLILGTTSAEIAARKFSIEPINDFE
jgi:hypothetical protein